MIPTIENNTRSLGITFFWATALSFFAFFMSWIFSVIDMFFEHKLVKRNDKLDEKNDEKEDKIQAVKVVDIPKFGLLYLGAALIYGIGSQVYF